eukprot:gb/GEZJ01005588.1/.p1 GENE.gb/GEZJ01005588.1/~~gb/GEZJ01005588.1/.p1  ORF type:complete len:522 (+),score=36.22 gb/GEZJ01005588.1/:556-2121(+)
MDPTQNRSLQYPSSSGTPTLLCVGGMLRVADAPDLTIAGPPSPAPSSRLGHHHVDIPWRTPSTPFRALASPFTANTPFTAPTTPYPYSTATPIPLRLFPTQTPLNSQPCNSIPSHSKSTNDIHGPNRVKALQKESQSTSHNLLTPKQVRELRRLCRKTANRAEFEDRLIQIRQVASIAAMASSSLHLFDPENPQSGHALRIWVETHRAGGADWRDERPLSDAAIGELRRWDRRLKAWARLRFETFNSCESVHFEQNTCVNSGATDTILRPVRLQFEQISVGTSPITPVNRVKNKGVGELEGTKAEVNSVRRMVSPTTPDEGNGFFLRSPHVDNTRSKLGINKVVGSLRGTYNPTEALCVSRREWSKISSPPLKDGGEQRRPLDMVSIDKVGDLINVTVPTLNAEEHPSRNVRGVTKLSSHGATTPSSCCEENVLCAKELKTWRSVVLDATQSSDREGDGRANAKWLSTHNLCGNSIRDHERSDLQSITPAGRTDLDWGRLRSGDNASISSLYSLSEGSPRD